MIRISLSSLDNNELLTFSLRVEELTEDVDADALGFRLYLDNFNTTAIAYKISSEKQSVSAKKVEELDSRRDGFYVALRSHLKNWHQQHPETTYRNNAKKLIDILNKDGKKIYRENYRVETAALIKIFKEVDVNWLPILNDLAGTMWYDFLKTAHVDFEAALKKHTKDIAESKKTKSASNARKPLEDALRDLLKFLPLHHKMTKASALGDLIDQLQVAADRF